MSLLYWFQFLNDDINFQISLQYIFMYMMWWWGRDVRHCSSVIVLECCWTGLNAIKISKTTGVLWKIEHQSSFWPVLKLLLFFMITFKADSTWTIFGLWLTLSTQTLINNMNQAKIMEYIGYLMKDLSQYLFIYNIIFKQCRQFYTHS